MRNCTHYKYIIYTRQMDFKLNTGSCCMGKKGCSKIQNNKLNTYDWLCDVPDAANATDYVEVQFKNTRKGYYLNSSKIPLEKGDLVAVEASPGHDIGTVTLTGKLVLLQMKKNNVRTGEGNEPKKVYRKAKPTDIEKYEEAKAKEHATMIRSRQIAADLGLNMKIGDVEYQGDGNKAIFYYIADERVDFRQLIKVLAEANETDWCPPGSRTHRRYRPLWARVVLFKLDDEFRICSHRSRPLSGYIHESPEIGRPMRQAEMLHQL